MGKVGQGSIDITDDLTWAMAAAFCVTKREKVPTTDPCILEEKAQNIFDGHIFCTVSGHDVIRGEAWRRKAGKADRQTSSTEFNLACMKATIFSFPSSCRDFPLAVFAYARIAGVVCDMLRQTRGAEVDTATETV